MGAGITDFAAAAKPALPLPLILSLSKDGNGQWVGLA
jgi:hypothetical protein